jgi:hypothetical protein
MVSVDAFDSPETMRRLWGELVRASAMDALLQPEDSQPVRAPLPRERTRHACGLETGTPFRIVIICH